MTKMFFPHKTVFKKCTLILNKEHTIVFGDYFEATLLDFSYRFDLMTKAEKNV